MRQQFIILVVGMAHMHFDASQTGKGKSIVLRSSIIWCKLTETNAFGQTLALFPTVNGSSKYVELRV